MPSRAGLAMFTSVFLPYALGHFLSSLLRNVNAVLAPQFMASMAVSSAQLGLLTSVFFFAFALAQLPVGMALDRHGPRKVQAILLLLAASGTLAFAGGRSFAQLVAARFLMGLGLGGSFMAGVKAISAAISPVKLPSVNGYLIAVGGIGAAAATLPVRLAASYGSWRTLFVWLALAVAATALVIWSVTPRAPASAHAGPRPGAASILAVYRHPAFRRTIALVLVPHAVCFGVQGMWVGRWLADVAGFSDAAVAYLLYLSMASVIFGAIAVGMVTEWLGRRGWTPWHVAAAGIVLFLLVQGGMLAVPGSGAARACQLLAVLFSLVGTITGIEYTIVAQTLPRDLTGRAATCLNLLIFVGAFLVQGGVGLVVACWTPDHAGHYPPAAYRTAFALLIAVQLPGLVQCLLSLRQSKDSHASAALRPARKGKTRAV